MGQPLPLVLDELVAHAKAVWRGPTVSWEPCQAEPEEMAAAEREAAAGDQFDKNGLKRGVWEAWRAGRARLVCRRCPFARVLCFLPAGVAEPDWAFWGRVFAWFGPAGGPTPTPWRVTWFAAQMPREFPTAAGQDLGPEHVNGGYTQPCSATGIYIYRAEEVTRVLIHEMLHATCLDEPGWSIPLREAMIETWAELILIALRSKGRPGVASKLWTAQSHWVADTNWKAAAAHGTHDISDYAWRYLVGRERMYARLGIALPPPRPAVAAHSTSLRFTHPSLEK